MRCRLGREETFALADAANRNPPNMLAIAHVVADTYALSITGELKTGVALFRLERQISTPKAFRKQYAAHVEKPLMRFTRGGVRGHIVSSKIDHGPP